MRGAAPHALSAPPTMEGFVPNDYSPNWGMAASASRRALSYLTATLLMGFGRFALEYWPDLLQHDWISLDSRASASAAFETGGYGTLQNFSKNFC